MPQLQVDLTPVGPVEPLLRHGAPEGRGGRSAPAGPDRRPARRRRHVYRSSGAGRGKSHTINLFAARNAVDPADAYRVFRGRDATIDALMRDRGFPVPD